MLEQYAEQVKHLRSKKIATLFSSLYGHKEGALLFQVDRYSRVIKRHRELYGAKPKLSYFSAPGRTEIGGNHTDHNAGRVLAAGIDLDTLIVASPNDTGIVTLHSEGYPAPFVVDLSDLTPRVGTPGFKGTTAEIIRGIAARMQALGYAIGGFDAVMTSNVGTGSGLSSSAACEVALCTAMDGLYNGMSIPGAVRAQIAQYAENHFYGKPCGLMDQTASALGGLITIDFRSEDAQIRTLSYDFDANGYAMVVVDGGDSHDGLDHYYASIRDDMKKVAAAFGCKNLREVLPEQVEEGIPSLRGRVSDRAILRALHFFDDNRRVVEEVDALTRNDLPRFLQLIVESGESSLKLLQNISVPFAESQGLALALEMSRRMLAGKGAWRVHGGGFAGTILAFVPHDMLNDYVTKMRAVFGDKACTALNVRAAGAIQLDIGFI